MQNIRYRYIQNQVLNAYKYYRISSFPINMTEVLKCTPHCLSYTYREFAEINNVNVNDVSAMGKSDTGYSIFRPDTNKYLILYNDDMCPGRINWTIAHELGHIYLRHLSDKITSDKSVDLSLFYESEADAFAQMFLAPFPLFDILNIKSVQDVMQICGLSHEAALHTYMQYNSWKRSHIKTAFEADLKNTFQINECFYFA